MLNVTVSVEVASTRLVGGRHFGDRYRGSLLKADQKFDGR